jgi:hypothetical protein
MRHAWRGYKSGFWTKDRGSVPGMRRARTGFSPGYWNAGAAICFVLSVALLVTWTHPLTACAGLLGAVVSATLGWYERRWQRKRS